MSYRHRVALLAVLAGCGAVLLLSRLLVVQVVEYDEWATQARAQAAGWIPTRGPRGDVRDANGAVLANDDATFDLTVRVAAWKGVRYECGYCGFHRYYKPDDKTGRCPRCKRTMYTDADGKRRPVFARADRRSLRVIADELGISQHELRARVEGRVEDAEKAVAKATKGLTGGRREQGALAAWADQGWRDRTIARDVSYAVAREVELHPERNPAFRIRTVTKRRQPGGAAFAHILGRTRVNDVRLVTPDGDTEWISLIQGLSRLEGRFDTELQGHPGWVRVVRDLRHRTRETFEPEQPIHGLDLQLTIAAADQERAFDALHGARGALAVVDAETGAVLALASAPSYAPEEYQRTVLASQKSKDPAGSPLLERACRSFYAPGSILKPFTAVAALTSGVATPATEVVCEHYFRNNEGTILRKALKCNGTHGRLDLRGALVHSCNIYFQTLMRKMLEANQFPEFEEKLRRFGLGRPTGIEIESGRSGRLVFRNNWYELISSSIGQGRITVSPAQMARAYAGLMTGYLPRLHLVARVGSRPTPIERMPLGVPEEVLGPVREALREVPVSGTASRYGLERYGIACKTGTAQRPQVHRYNAWIAGFAPARDGRPAIAFAMVVLDTRHHSGDACGPRLHEFFQRFYEERPQ